MSDSQRVVRRQNADTRIFQPQLLCSLIRSRLSVVFVNRTTLRRTAKQLLESIRVVKFSERQVDVIFA